MRFRIDLFFSSHIAQLTLMSNMFFASIFRFSLWKRMNVANMTDAIFYQFFLWLVLLLLARNIRLCYMQMNGSNDIDSISMNFKNGKLFFLFCSMSGGWQCNRWEYRAYYRSTPHMNTSRWLMICGSLRAVLAFDSPKQQCRWMHDIVHVHAQPTTKYYSFSASMTVFLLVLLVCVVYVCHAWLPNELTGFQHTANTTTELRHTKTGCFILMSFINNILCWCYSHPPVCLSVHRPHHAICCDAIFGGLPAKYWSQPQRISFMNIEHKSNGTKKQIVMSMTNDIWCRHAMMCVLGMTESHLYMKLLVDEKPLFTGIGIQKTTTQMWSNKNRCWRNSHISTRIWRC